MKLSTGTASLALLLNTLVVSSANAVHPWDGRAIGDSCRASGASVDGQCEDLNSFPCNGYYVNGKCPNDPNNIKCCTTFQQCGNGGFCNDINHVGCSVPYKKNLCPGGPAVQCCEGASEGATLGMTPSN